ncbi:MAG TPA: pirin family protein, partial [Dongiaceae bacterium]|nr:pirin family protein [Dongiaceae bacterium]
MAQAKVQTTAEPKTERRVVTTIRGRAASDGAGVKLTRVIGQPALPDLDPFLMLDEFGSDRGADYIGGFPDHPHRGFETVTYMLAGRMRHGDNQGNVGLLRPGSVQWMTAGRGIVHSEMPEQEEGLMQGFQLWVNLPARDKMTKPRYQDIDPEKVPVVERADGTRVKVLVGSFDGVSGPVTDVATDPLYLDVTLPAGVSANVPVEAEHNAFAYVFQGTAKIGAGEAAQMVERGQLAVLSLGDSVTVEGGAKGSRLILVAGRPLREPVAKYGPFVMNTQDEIRQAIADYQAGKFV